MSSDIQCHLYTKTLTKDDIVRIHTFFQKIKLYVQESHLFRYVLKCDECGQLYFYEFKEEIDWDEGNDTQYNTYIPVATLEDADTLSEMDSFKLLTIFPRLQYDTGKGTKGDIVWVKEK